MTGSVCKPTHGAHRIIVGDVMDGLRSMADGTVQCVVTSPPYWGLRDYGADGQIGLEDTPEQYVARLVAVFREVRRVLRDDGTLWVNLGDCYCTHPPGNRDVSVRTSKLTNPERQLRVSTTSRGAFPGLKPKDLVGIPWRVAFALQADGWWLRRDIIWEKPNQLPESVTDRPTGSHEYVFLMTKAARYYYDAEAIREADSGQDHRRRVLSGQPSLSPPGQSTNRGLRTKDGRNGDGRNARSVWTITTQPYPEAHFATFPEALPERCILAGTSEKGCCPECGKPWSRVVEREATGFDGSKYGERVVRVSTSSGGTAKSTLGSGNGKMTGKYHTTGWRPNCECGGPGSGLQPDPVPCLVLDPFSGSGTTLAVACQLGRDAIGIELSPDYARLAERRIGKALRPNTYRDDTIIGDAPLFTDGV